MFLSRRTDFGQLSRARRVLISNAMGSGVKRFTDLRAWQACDEFKRAIYDLCEEEAIGVETAKSFCDMRGRPMESQNHLIDFVHKKYINEERRRELNGLAEIALEEVTGLVEYLQSPEVLRNARRARERRMSSRSERRARNTEPRTANRENAEPEPNSEPEHEPGRMKRKGELPSPQEP